MKLPYIALMLLMMMSGCTVSHPKSPDGFSEKILTTEYFSIAVWEKDVVINKPLRIYIEGDGTPTPRRPIALELAARDPDENVVYVSRPCQYAYSKECKNPAIWKEERFHEEIVNEMKSLITYLAYKYETPSLELVGYDGGGTMAMLLATKIPVAKVITIGGILDTNDYADEHNLDSINGLNPADFKNILSQIEQIHYVGGKDKTTPRWMAERFVSRLPQPKSAIVKIIPAATHTDWSMAPFDYYHSAKN